MTPDGWTASQHAAPVIRLDSEQPGLAGGGFGARDSHDRRGANTDNVNASIVMSLLVASTGLALYDLYVLLRTLTGIG